MAEPYQSPNINTGSAQQAIAGTQVVTPALGDLMSGIKEGFISAMDIQKRALGTPLEMATRAQDMADVSQIRPLRREVATTQLQNMQTAEQFEASTLPIMNATKRATLEQAHQNALQFGVPDDILKVFYATVPGFMPFDPDKLHDKKTGQVNIPYANELIIKAKEAAKKMELSKPVNVTTKNISAAGAEESFQQLVNPLTGVGVGPKISTGTVAPDAAKAAESKAGLSNDVLAERQRSDIIKAYVPQARAFEAIDGIRYRSTPPKNADDLAILYEFIKVLDPTSVVREGEKKFAESTAPGMQAFYNRVQGIFSDSNKTMDPDTRNNLYATIDTLKGASEKSVLPELKRLSNLAIDRGVPLSQALTEPEIKLLVNGPAVPGQPSPAVPGVAAGAGAGAGAVPAAAAAGGIPTVSTVEQVRALPPNVQFFKDPTGQTRVNPNWKGAPVTP